MAIEKKTIDIVLEVEKKQLFLTAINFLFASLGS